MNTLFALKPETEFRQGLDNIRNLITWFLLSEDIKGDLEKQAAMHKKEAFDGRADKKAV